MLLLSCAMSPGSMRCWLLLANLCPMDKALPAAFLHCPGSTLQPWAPPGRLGQAADIPPAPHMQLGQLPSL